MRLLDRYILSDLFRATLLAAGVLVTVTAFGAAIKPLAKESLLSVGQTVKYIVLAIVPMLQFSLPFAAGFASTLSMHRMTTDNEVLAVAAGGISYRRVLMPIAALGLALTIVMGGLTQWVIPRFWAVLQTAVTKDVTKLFEASIKRGEAFQIGDRQIRADEVFVQPHPDGNDNDTRLVLIHVVAASLDGEGRIDRDVTANRAVVDIYRRSDFTYIKLAMEDTVAYDPDGGVLAWAERLDTQTIAIPTRMTDATRHKTFGELLELRRHPDRYGSIIRRKVHLADALRDDEVSATVDARLAAGETVALFTPGGIRYEVTSDRIDEGRFRNDDGSKVEVVVVEDGRERRRMEAGGVRLSSRLTVPDRTVTFDLILSDYTVVDIGGSAPPNQRKAFTVEGLALENFTAPDLSTLPSAELIARVEAKDAGIGLITAAKSLSDRLESLEWEISGRLHKRCAISLTALLLVTLGATLAMWMRGSLPLMIYLCAFLPSVLDLVLISGGEQLLRDGRIVGGITVLWSGNVVLLGILVVVYMRLARH